MLTRCRRGIGGTQKNKYSARLARVFSLVVAYLQQEPNPRRLVRDLVRDLRYLGQKAKSQPRRIG